MMLGPPDRLSLVGQRQSPHTQAIRLRGVPVLQKTSHACVLIAQFCFLKGRRSPSESERNLRFAALASLRNWSISRFGREEDF